MDLRAWGIAENVADLLFQLGAGGFHVSPKELNQTVGHLQPDGVFSIQIIRSDRLPQIANADHFAGKHRVIYPVVRVACSEQSSYGTRLRQPGQVGWLDTLDGLA